jgi:hypothetical protein
VLGRVRECLRDRVVRRHLDTLRQPPGDLHVDLDRNPGAADNCPHCGCQPALVQNRRMEAAGDLPQFLDHIGQPLGSAGPLLRLAPLLRRHAGFRHPELERQRDQPLLRRVEVAFDTTARLVRRGDDPRPGGSELIPALGVGNRERHEFAEGAQMLLRAIRISRGTA